MVVKTDVVVVGGGLTGLVAACQLIDRGRKVVLLDQEPRSNLGGQAFWSLRGLFMVDTPEQRRMGIRDSIDLARQDWLGSAAFDRDEDYWPRRWAEAFLQFSAGEMRSWLYAQGMRWFPVVGWAERGGGLAGDHGNSVPRFHITWGTGPGSIEPFVGKVLSSAAEGRIELLFRHRVTNLVVTDGRVTGVSGDVLDEDDTERGAQTNRTVVGEFELSAEAVVVASGGIGGNHDLVRKNWPTERLGAAPRDLISGVPHHVDGLMLEHTARAGAQIINADRMWHYTEGVRNWDPIWPKHGIRILPGPSSLWFDQEGNRLPIPALPGFDTLGTLEEICKRGHNHSWFVTTHKIVKKEFALSGSEQNPDLTERNLPLLLKSRLGNTATPPVEAFKEKGEDFVVSATLEELVQGMNRIGDHPISLDHLREQIEARDRELSNPFAKDLQVVAMRQARAYRGDKFMRTAKPHRILDPSAGPLIAVRLNILTRKSLGGIAANLNSQALRQDGSVFDGLYACGEAAGFGGGGYHGYRALEGTFLGGCIFSGKIAGENA